MLCETCIAYLSPYKCQNCPPHEPMHVFEAVVESGADGRHRENHENHKEQKNYIANN